MLNVSYKFAIVLIISFLIRSQSSAQMPPPQSGVFKCNDALSIGQVNLSSLVYSELFSINPNAASDGTTNREAIIRKGCSDIKPIGERLFNRTKNIYRDRYYRYDFQIGEAGVVPKFVPPIKTITKSTNIFPGFDKTQVPNDVDFARQGPRGDQVGDGGGVPGK
jgi:hypothetical protein